MPNWVFNTLSVRGDKADLEKFAEEMAKPNPRLDYQASFSFNNIVPMPEEALSNPDWDWWNWNVSNWGVKWDCSDANILDFTEDEILYEFNTPWDSVTRLMYSLAQKYPHLEIMYEYEEEQGWGGEIVFKDGVIAYEAEWDIPASHADFANHPNRECYCVENPFDEDFRFDDCPKVEVEV